MCRRIRLLATTSSSTCASSSGSSHRWSGAEVPSLRKYVMISAAVWLRASDRCLSDGLLLMVALCPQAESTSANPGRWRRARAGQPSLRWGVILPTEPPCLIDDIAVPLVLALFFAVHYHVSAQAVLAVEAVDLARVVFARRVRAGIAQVSKRDDMPNSWPQYRQTVAAAFTSSAHLGHVSHAGNLPPITCRLRQEPWRSSDSERRPDHRADADRTSASPVLPVLLRISRVMAA